MGTGYFLVNKETKEKKEVKATSYTEALKFALEEIGYSLEAEDVERVLVVTETDFKENALGDNAYNIIIKDIPIGNTPVVKVVGVKQPETPKGSYVTVPNQIMNLVKGTSYGYTVEELAEKTKSSVSTIKTNLNYVLPKLGYVVIKCVNEYGAVSYKVS